MKVEGVVDSSLLRRINDMWRRLFQLQGTSGSSMRFSYVLATGFLFGYSGMAGAEQKPLWEVGFGFFTLTSPDYRGSDESRVPLPVLAALLAGAGLLHLGLLRDLRRARDIGLALAIGVLGFETNLALALACGLVVWWGATFAARRIQP